MWTPQWIFNCFSWIKKSVFLLFQFPTKKKKKAMKFLSSPIIGLGKMWEWNSWFSGETTNVQEEAFSTSPRSPRRAACRTNALQGKWLDWAFSRHLPLGFCCHIASESIIQSICSICEHVDASSWILLGQTTLVRLGCWFIAVDEIID